MKLLIVDNYDSFTFNLYHLAAKAFDTVPVVLTNDRPLQELVAGNFDAIIISPGPGTPARKSDIGISEEAILNLNIPVLGVCLGHQAICHLFGGSVSHAPMPVHGREFTVTHDGKDLFAEIPNPFTVVRYHSLAAQEPLPECLRKTAWTSDGVVMGLAHASRPLWGVQFHPESICSTFGEQLMRNFGRMARAFHANTGRDISCGRRVDQPSPNLSLASTRAKETCKKRLFVKRCPLEHTAEQLFETVFRDKPYAFWLDSSLTRPSDARFSFLGGSDASEVECVRYYAHSGRLSLRRGDLEELSTDDLLPYLTKRIAELEVEATDLPFDLHGGFVGYFGYELKALCGARAAHRSPYPDCLAMLANRFLAIDHFTNELYLLYIGEADEEHKADCWFRDLLMKAATCARALDTRSFEPETIKFVLGHSESEYLANIDKCLLSIRDGETYEVCLTNQITARNASVDPFEYYKTLRRHNPAPYSCFLKFPEVSVACSSPERFLKIDRSAQVETKPIKGTVRRGVDAEQDEALKQSLAQDEKSRSENLMIVDLLRNDLGRVCSIGSVHVSKLMHVETYATVHQLVSTVNGALDTDRGAVDCLHAAFPGGSMTGAPKLRTMEIIDALEGCARGIYSGSIGFLSLNGRMDLNIVIRTAVFSKNTVAIGVGGAVIALSDPQDEWAEIMLKAKALLATFQAMNKEVLLMDRPVDDHANAFELSKRVG